MNLEFFPTQTKFRNWLKRNHDTRDELWVGYYKKATGIPSITWQQSVDEALCFGWIDGVRKSIDEQRYRIRFTPRRPRSNWSDVNIKRVGELMELGKMQPAGLQAFEKRIQRKSTYSYESKTPVLAKEFEDILKKEKKAWQTFMALAPSYKRMSINFVMSAKKEETRQRRFAVLLDSCRRGLRLPQLNIGKK